MQGKKLIKVCTIIFLINLTIMGIYITYASPRRCYIEIDSDTNVQSIIPETFLSFGIDASEIQNAQKVPFENIRFQQLTAELSPAHLRLGGTMSDRLIFFNGDVAPSCENCTGKFKSKQCATMKKLCKKKPLPYFIMKSDEWVKINEFCKSTKVKLLFTLNVLLRNDHYWNSDNAKDLIQFSAQKKYAIDWQLGNEPNSFPHVFNVSVSPEQLAHDFKTLKSLLKHFGYNNSLLVGPDTTRPQPNRPECLKYMVEFLGNASNIINVRAWHHYYLNSRTSNLTDFWNPHTYELLHQQINKMKMATKAYDHIPMWLSETSSSYGGGAPGLSDSFAGTPLWLDKLGLSAFFNITTVIRQSLFGGNYSLIDKQLNPSPDWWVSVIYKKLIGNKVLKLNCECSAYQRFYVHCANQNYTNETGSLALYGINLEYSMATFQLNGTGLSQEGYDIDEFVIRPPSNNRESKIIMLNTYYLHYVDSLPELKPVKLKNAKKIRLPPYSVGFWVIKNTNVTACINVK